jgi:N6-adenosine-specific RNA methylase IME4
MAQQQTFWRDITIGPYTLTSTGVEIKGKPSLGYAESAIGWLIKFGQLYQFHIGEIWSHAKTDHGAKAYQIIASQLDEAGLHVEQATLDEWRRVAEAVAKGRRRISEGLSYSHHQAVAACSPADQDRILGRAVDDKLSLAEVRKAARLVRERRVSAGTADLAGTYRAILVDPEYREHAIKDIAKWPVAAHATRKAVLFLRYYDHQRRDWPALLDAWGFESKATQIWDRVARQDPHAYLNLRHEYVAIATRGGAVAPDRTAPLLDSVQTHRSDGPVPVSAIQAVVEQLYDGPYLLVTAPNEMAAWEPKRKLYAI